MALPKWAITVTPLSKTLAIIIFITFPILGFLLGMEYQSSFNISKKETIVLPTSIEPSCAKVGERPVSNFDLRTGKINPDIKKIDCCSGLKNIEKKQPTINRNPDVCAQNEGVLDTVCSPCGNSVCDSQYEDRCNCPKDCK